jgi:hypothetical protein
VHTPGSVTAYLPSEAPPPCCTSSVTGEGDAITKGARHRRSSPTCAHVTACTSAITTLRKGSAWGWWGRGEHVGARTRVVGGAMSPVREEHSRQDKDRTVDRAALRAPAWMADCTHRAGSTQTKEVLVDGGWCRAKGRIEAQGRDVNQIMSVTSNGTREIRRGDPPACWPPH